VSNKETALLPSYLNLQKQGQQSHILNPYLLTKELDAYYHVFIDRFQKIEKQITNNKLASGDIIRFLKNNKDVKPNISQIAKCYIEFM